ncbi:MAG: D-alanyl-D-alanine carboxypeptidase [Alphaproteobacteria bacterium]|nr:D-alanyl-D-alanine carboxypeptidase [Alphaproteobacteria bacterium]
MKTLFVTIFCIVLTFSQISFAKSQIQTSAKQAIVFDYETSAVLFNKNADQRMPTSSMSKAMSMYMIFEALKKGALSLDEKLLVSNKAWLKGGSKMFVEVDTNVTVEDLIRGVIVQSGNDATIVLAEGISDSEYAFAENATLKAYELGMKNSNFVNASGWPDPDHYSTARDLSILAAALIRDFPKLYLYFAEQEFTYNNIKQRNRNPLLYRNIGADGIKTGHTKAGGYGLMGSGVCNGRRIILVVNGLKNEKDRAGEAAKLLEWGLRHFKNRKIFNAGDIVENVAVVMSKKKTISAKIHKDLTITIPKLDINSLKVYAKFNEPLIAPVKKGDEIGTIVIEIINQEIIEHPLYAGENADTLGLISTIFAKAKLFFLSRGENVK